MRFTASLALAAALLFGASAAHAQSADLAQPAPAGTPAVFSPKPAPASSNNLGPNVLFDQATLVTSPGGGPGGTDLSTLQSTSLGMNTIGAGHQQNLGNFVADDFDVPAGQTWSVTSMNFYAYQTGGTPSASTITGYYVQIWDGDPSLPASTIIAGDLTTNVLTSSAFSNIYRVTETTTTATNRPIYKSLVTFPSPISLTSGTYWVQWGATGSLASGPWLPPVTIVGQTVTGNAQQFLTPPGAWQPLNDTGTGTPQQGAPFQVLGTNGPISGPVLGVMPGAVAFGTVSTGSTNTQTVTLTNNGTAPLTISSVTYTGDAGVTITQPAATTLAPGASTTMTATFGPTTAGAITGTISIATNAPGSPATVAVTGMGMAPPPPGTYPSTDTPVTIPDNTPGGVTSTIVVPATETRTITDLDVDLNITHSWTGDLIIMLAKGTTMSTLMDRPGYTGTGFGCSGNDPNIIADDEGMDGSIEDSCTPTTSSPAYPVPDGRYTPFTPLSVFDTTPAAGTYVLTISDNAAGDTGTLDSWALLATLNGGTAAGDSPVAADLLTIAPNPVATQGQVSLTVGTTQDVRVALYDALGREVMTLLDRSVSADQVAYIGFSTQSLPAGVYVVRATGTDLALTERITVVR